MAENFGLERFTEVQRGAYDRAVSELRQGEKRTHWMWYIFPQLAGLGRSSTAIRYGIASIDEARAYLEHPVLGPRLIECTKLVLEAGKTSPSDIFPYPDDLKFRSCMTLFANAAPAERVFDLALQKFYAGEPDPETCRLLGV
jgi:uncharacterized protein (DUF1810 family)